MALNDRLRVVQGHKFQAGKPPQMSPVRLYAGGCDVRSDDRYRCKARLIIRWPEDRILVRLARLWRDTCLPPE